MISSRFIRYIIAGSTNTGLMILLLYVLNNALSLNYLLATSLSFIFVLIISYITHKYWTFQNQVPAHIKQFSRHGLLFFINFFLNISFMYLFVTIINTPLLIAQAISSGIIALVSFSVYTIAIFTTHTISKN